MRNQKNLLILVWLILTAILLPLMHSFRIYNNRGFFGDQVHFLIMTESIIQDGDLNVKNQYQQETYWEYFHTPQRISLEPHLSKNRFDDQSPAWYSIHNPGLAILLVPGFLLAGANGAAFTMILIDFLVIFLLWLWVYQTTKSVGGAFLSAVVLFSSPFFIGQIGYIFTDMPILAIILACLIILMFRRKQWWHYFVLSLLLGVGFWIHIKITLIVFTVYLFALWQILINRKTNRYFWLNIFALTVPVSILLVAFEWKIWQWYHTIVPYLPFAANQMFAVNPLRTFAAWLFDGAQGLFSVNPLFWLLLVGLPVWYYRNHRQLQQLFVIVCPTFFLFLTFDDWCGGYSPSGRYIITFAPLLLPAIGYLFSTVLHYNFLKIITVFLLIIQILLSCVYVHCQNDWTLSGQRSEIFLSIEKKTHLTLDYFMPHFTGYLELIYTNQICYVIFYFVLAAFLVYFGIRLFHRYSSAEHCLTVKPD